MHKTGYVICNDEAYQINSSLFDSGAQSDNFISESFVNKYSTIF